MTVAVYSPVKFILQAVASHVLLVTMFYVTDVIESCIVNLDDLLVNLERRDVDSNSC